MMQKQCGHHHIVVLRQWILECVESDELYARHARRGRIFLREFDSRRIDVVAKGFDRNPLFRRQLRNGDEVVAAAGRDIENSERSVVGRKYAGIPNTLPNCSGNSADTVRLPKSGQRATVGIAIESWLIHQLRLSI